VEGFAAYIAFSIASILVSRLEAVPFLTTKGWANVLLGPIQLMALPLTIGILACCWYFVGWQTALAWFLLGLLATNGYALFTKVMPILGSFPVMLAGLILILPLSALTIGYLVSS